MGRDRKKAGMKYLFELGDINRAKTMETIRPITTAHLAPFKYFRAEMI